MTVAAHLPNTSGHSFASTGTWSISDKVHSECHAGSDGQPRHLRGEPVRCDVPVGRLTTDQRHRDQRQHNAAPSPPGPGRSPIAMPTPTGIPATKIAVSGDTTEIGPEPSAA